MAAIVEIGGFQYEVDKDKKIDVPFVEGKSGDTVEFANVLFNDNDGDLNFGSPYLDGANVKAKIVEQGRDKKVLVFHKKRRKGYQKLNGHRQKYTKIEITDIKV